MLTEINRDFKFVNIAGGAFSELVGVTKTTVVSDYRPATEGGGEWVWFNHHQDFGY